MQGPEGKYLFGLVKIGEKGQIVIPKEARDVFGLKPGDQLLMVGDIKQGIALVHPDMLGLFKILEDNPIPGFDGAGKAGDAPGAPGGDPAGTDATGMKENQEERK